MKYKNSIKWQHNNTVCDQINQTVISRLFRLSSGWHRVDHKRPSHINMTPISPRRRSGVSERDKQPSCRRPRSHALYYSYWQYNIITIVFYCNLTSALSSREWCHVEYLINSNEKQPTYEMKCTVTDIWMLHTITYRIFDIYIYIWR